MEIKQIIEKQREFFESGATLDINYRKAALKKLYDAILSMEDEITQAIYKDLNKNSFDSFLTETGLCLEEIKFMLKNLNKFSKIKPAKRTLTQFLGNCYKVPSPYGTVLIMSPWNYPLQLAIVPLIDALAAGNTAIVKPSAYSPYTSDVIKKLIDKCFKDEYVYVVQGGRDVNQELLEHKYDYIFFTGGKNVGRLVMEKASKHLTPVTLELGGKSPCLIDETADLKLTAKRIMFGKCLNAGQTCVAPDYGLVHESVKDELLYWMRYYVKEFFGDDVLHNDNFAKMINDKHFNRVTSLIEPDKVAIGGKSDKDLCKIELTVLDNITLDSPVMQEEIFGPVFPLITFKNLNEAVDIIKSFPHPLAFYLFTSDKYRKKALLSSIQFGGGCVNDTILHLATTHTGFGGVGESGMGSYHGKTGFDTFTHYKSVLDNSSIIDMPLRYQPWTKTNLKLVRKIMK